MAAVGMDSSGAGTPFRVRASHWSLYAIHQQQPTKPCLMRAFRILTSVADPGCAFCIRHWQSSNLLSRKPGRSVISNNVAYLVVFVSF